VVFSDDNIDFDIPAFLRRTLEPEKGRGLLLAGLPSDLQKRVHDVGLLTIEDFRKHTSSELRQLLGFDDAEFAELLAALRRAGIKLRSERKARN
jgi:hypothetical protein